jgi:hypothetical protein
MPSVRHDLLQPSLSDPARLSLAPYSQQTALLSAFFGGPLALAIVFAVDSRRLSRLGRDAAWIALVLVVYIGWLVVMHKTVAGQQALSFLYKEIGRSGPQMIERLIALLGFTLAALLHRKEQRSANLFALPRPNGWIMGIGVIAFGYIAGDALNVALA